MFNFIFTFKIYVHWHIGTIIPECIHMCIVGQRSFKVFGEIPRACYLNIFVIILKLYF